MEKLLKLRINLKRKKPNFRRQDSHKKAKLSKAWRKPKGSDSKIRRGLRGYLKKPEIGWGSPKTVKGITKKGLVQIRVSSEKDIEKIKDASKECALISGKTGKRKKATLIKKLIERNITIDNIKNPKDYLKKIEKEMDAKKQKKEKLSKEKEKKRKEKEKETKKSEKKEELEEKVDLEEKKKEEIREKEKILTRKE